MGGALFHVKRPLPSGCAEVRDVMEGAVVRATRLGRVWLSLPEKPPRKVRENFG